MTGETLEELKAKAAVTSGGEQALLCARVAREEVELANQHFTDGKVEEGQAAVRDAVAYAAKARDAARTSKKKLKQTEIAIGRAARRLNDISKTLAIDDRPTVEQAVKELGHIQDQLLDAMFGEGKRQP
ncbi:MAG TPA: hypothetical protein VGQ94_07050 [Terriglobales bacterium]|nr:hypothetical protein [Terriglobales bacterium]